MVTAMLAAVAIGWSSDNEDIDYQLANWKPVAADRLEPPQDRWIKDADIVGRWMTVRGYSGVEIERLLPHKNRFAVAMTIGSCTQWMTRRATGTYQDGTLLLDQPVWEAEPVDRFYVVHLKGKPRMVTPRGWHRTEIEMRDYGGAIVGELTYGLRQP